MNEKSLMPSLAAPVDRSLHSVAAARRGGRGVEPSGCVARCVAVGRSYNDCWNGCIRDPHFDETAMHVTGRYHVK